MVREVIDCSSVELQPTVVSLFVDQAARTPHAIALALGNATMSYSELGRRSDQLANYLTDRGVCAETLVGLCLERSFEMVIGILGILKAGGAYVPLDPDYPADRLAFMVRDSDVSLVLTQHHLLNRIPETDAVPLCLDSDWEQIQAQTAAAVVETIVGPDNLIYVIYTSGSTGTPKGVMNTHAGVLNRITWMRDSFAVGPHDRILQKTPFSFDVSGWEFFVPLVSGACLVIAAPGGHLDPDYLVETIQMEQITAIHFVPSMLNLFLEAPGVELCRSLRWVYCSGEALSATTRDRFFSKLECELHNLYGPTEAAIEVTHWQCSRDDNDPVIPIGWPIPNTTAYIVGKEGLEVTGDTAGELCLGGVSVARGYLNRPELTDETFIPDPFDSFPGGRLYRTGDLARRRSDGSIEYLGRMDFQVKIRGQRIELGEIEVVLASNSDVNEVVVLAREDFPGDQRLVAYVVLASRGAGDVAKEAALKSVVRTKLPEYMVPAHVVFLTRLPLSPNGKVDRRSLPAPSIGVIEDTHDVAARTSTEKLVAEIWGEVLRIPHVGNDQSFFEVGGHSLLAAQIVARLRNKFGIRLSVRSLFTYATIESLSAFIDESLTEQPETADVGETIVRSDLPVLSPMQRWLGYACTRYPNSPVYNISVLLVLNGSIDLTALQRAVQAIVDRHEPLRAWFREQDGALETGVRDAMPVYIARHDAVGDDVEAGCARTRDEVTRAIDRQFDLENDPLIRCDLWTVGVERILLLVTVHHLVFDGWSEGIFIRELGAFYRSEVTGCDPDVAPLPVRYRDYAAWLAAQQVGDANSERLKYWNHQLDGVPELLDIPTDYARSVVRCQEGACSQRGGRIGVNISVELTEKLMWLSRENHVTLYMSLMAAWQVLLYRYSSQADFVVYSPLAGRTHSTTEGLIGYFVNFLPIRARLDGAESIRTLLQQVRDVCLEAQAHQDISVSVEHLDTIPAVQAVMVLQNMPEHEARFEGTKCAVETLNATGSKFELCLTLAENEKGLKGYIEYSSDLYRDSTIQRLAGHFERVVEAFVADADCAVDVFPLISNDDQAQLTLWNGTGYDYPDDISIHRLFEAQAEATPDRISLQFGSKEISFRELNQEANRLAHFLRKRGVAAHSLVGLCATRSIEMVTAMLAILKVGAAYVPLDPEYPEDRLRFMLEDADIRFLLTQKSVVERLPLTLTQEIVAICLDDAEHWSGEDGLSSPSGSVSVSSDDLCYVMYTSGSTGRAKGVCIPHRGVVRLVKVANYATFTPDDVFLQYASISFDASTLEIWAPLLNGGKLVIAPPGLLSLSQLGALVRDHHITTLWLTASLFHLMVMERLDDLKGLKQLLAGGDILPMRAVRRFLSEAHGCTLINGYGPTESTTFACCHVMTTLDEAGDPVPIGRPISNTRVYIVNQAGVALPVGSVGELAIAGDGLARGYLNNMELTQQKFVTGLPACPHERLYLTGDLARWRSDGVVEFIGREDYQVKIRGYRVEPGEVEAALEEIEAVRQCVVIAAEDGTGARHLVAYVVFDDASELTQDALPHILAGKLPHYMVPSVYVTLDALPLNANGKLDRNALPDPQSAKVLSDSMSFEPANEIEKVLGGIWCRLMRVKTIGANQNFFEIGGHSLLAIQMFARIDTELGVRANVSMLYQYPTIRSLAKRLQDGPGRETHRLNPIQVGGSLPPIFCLYRLDGMDMCYRELAVALGPDQPVYGVQHPALSGGEDRPAEAESMEELADNCIRDIRSFYPDGPYTLIGSSFGGVLAYAVAQQMEAQNLPVALVAMMDAFGPAALRDRHARSVPEKVMAHLQALWNMSWADRIAYLRVRLGGKARLGGNDDGLAHDASHVPDVTEEIRRLQDANMKAYWNYQPVPIAANIVLFRSEERNPFRHDNEPNLWWGDLVAREQIENVPGDHSSMMEGRYVQQLAARVRYQIDRSFSAMKA